MYAKIIIAFVLGTKWTSDSSDNRQFPAWKLGKMKLFSEYVANSALSAQVI